MVGDDLSDMDGGKAARKPSIFPAWLGFWSGDQPPPESTASLVPLGEKPFQSSGNSIRRDVTAHVSGLIGLDVRTFAGMGVIERVYKDEDEPDEGGFILPPVFIVEVKFGIGRGYLD